MSSNANLISAWSSLGMVCIWVLYLQLFYRSYRRQLRPELLIHLGGNFTIDSLCMITNMGESAVHVSAVLVDVDGEAGHATWQPMDPRGISPDAQDPFRYIYQGPLETAQYFTVRSFRDLLEEGACRATGRDEIDALGDEVTMTVRVISFIGAELFPTGASRQFRIRLLPDRQEVRPVSVVPVQLSTLRHRKVARQWLEELQTLDQSDVDCRPKRDPEERGRGVGQGARDRP